VSVVFSGSASGPIVHVSDSTFLQCRVAVSYNNGVIVGNGMPDACIAARAAVWCMIDACAGYGGGLSVYFGFSAGLQLLDVASFSLALHRNDFARCYVIFSSYRDEYSGGNVYGGGVSVYMGVYSSSLNPNGDAVAAVGDTAVRNASVRVETASFTSCSATTMGLYGGNSYGGSFSLYLGGYAWSVSLSSSSSSSSTSGSTTASGVSVSISNVNSSGCSATTTGLYGGNSYGGSLSLYLGGYAWSFSGGGGSSSSSTSGLTTASGVSVSISNVNSSGCSATTAGGNSYGGSFSLYLGGYAWSHSGSSSSRSTSGLTTASGVSVSISNVNSSGCSATTKGSDGGNSYGGSMSVVYIGAYAWSSTYGSSLSSSSCGATNVTGLVVSISSSTFADSSAASRTFHSAPLFSFP